MSDDGLVERAERRVGLTLRNKWHLDALLGVGGMAAVYAATHRNGKRGAVKLLHLELSTSEEVRARFLREGYVANKVDHPGVVSVLDDDVTEDGAVYLVMELLEGKSVEQLACAQPTLRLALPQVVAIGDQLLDTLACAHDKGIVHRDLKPDNVFVTGEGQVKVLDFGIARLREQSSASATRTGSVMGTPAFMAPEQALGNWKDVDGRTDLWAVGATMYQILTGRAVHEADTVSKILLAAMTKAAAPITSVWPHVPAEVASVVDRALAFEREARWPDARAMQEALRIAAHRLGIPYDRSAARLTLVSGDRQAAAAATVSQASLAQPAASLAQPATPVAQPSPSVVQPSAWSAQASIAQPSPSVVQPPPSVQAYSAPAGSHAYEAPQSVAADADPLAVTTASGGGPMTLHDVRPVSATLSRVEPVPRPRAGLVAVIVAGVLVIGGAAAGIIFMSGGDGAPAGAAPAASAEVAPAQDEPPATEPSGTPGDEADPPVASAATPATSSSAPAPTASTAATGVATRPPATTTPGVKVPPPPTPSKTPPPPPSSSSKYGRQW